MLNTAIRFTNPKATIPVLQNIAVRDGVLMATDLDTWYLAPSDMPDCCVSAKDLQICLDGAVSPVYDIVGTKLRIRDGNSESLIETIDIERFPELPEANFTGGVTIPAETFALMVKQTAFAVTKAMSRFTLQGLKLIANRSTKLVTTDGHRLSLAEQPITGEFEGLLRLKALTEAVRLKSDVTLSTDGTWTRIECGKETIITRNLSGTFPNYEIVLPKDNDIFATINKDALSKSVSKLSKITPKLDISISPNSLSIIANGDSFSKTEIEIEATGEIDFSINGPYLMDILKVVKSVNLSAKNVNTPIEFVDEGLRHVMMPLR